MPTQRARHRPPLQAVRFAIKSRAKCNADWLLLERVIFLITCANRTYDFPSASARKMQMGCSPLADFSGCGGSSRKRIAVERCTAE
jgi:hypothetical protein